MGPPYRVAITGLGAVTALGNDVPALWDAARRGLCGISAIDAIPIERLSARTAAQVRNFEAASQFDRKKLPMLDRAAQLALAGAREAMGDAAPGAFDPGRIGVVLGAANGQETFDSAYRTFYGDGARGVPPLTVPRIMPSAGTSHISMEFGIRGPSFSTASACASASHAMGQAFHMVRAGMLDLAITGGGDASIVVGFIKGWEALRVLSPDVCRPFSRDRAGLVLGEGAGILVLEPFERAAARGAAIHAEMVGFGMSADASDLTAPDADGAAAAMRAALEDAGLRPEQVDYINAHGTGTRLNDRTEVLALHKVFGERVPPVSSSKSMLGHCMSACGAVELVLTVLALRDGVLPPTVGFREADPECDIDCVPNISRPAPVQVALSNSFAFGGLNAVLAVRRVA